MRRLMEHFPRASAKANRHFISIEILYGMSMGILDKDVENIFLPPDMEDDEILGEAVLFALKSSRPVYADELPVICNHKRNKELYDEGIKQMMKRFKCRTKGDLMRRTKSVFISKNGDFISFSPSRQEKLDAWSGISDQTGDVVISFSSKPAEIGAALRLAFDRCIA